MGRLTVETAGRADARTGEFVEAFARRVEAMPPGQCPVGLVLGQLQASAAQTCGKCVPCRIGLGQLNFSQGTLVGLFNSVVNFAFVFAANSICRKLTHNSLW